MMDVAPPGAGTESISPPLATSAAPGASPIPMATDLSQAGSPAWRTIVAQAALIWLGTRVAFALLTYFAILFATSGKHKAGPITTGFASIPPHVLLSAWARWDAVSYLAIAQHGYAAPTDAAFFPLYPLLIAAVTLIVGSAHQLLAAMLVSNLGSLAAFIGLALLAARESGNESPTEFSRPLRVFAAYPFAFLLVAPYADGVFLGLAFFALYMMGRGRWRWATLCVFLATLTHLTGLILLAPLLWEYGRAHGWMGGKAKAPGLRGGGTVGDTALVVLAAPAALAVFAGYLAVRFGQPLAFLQSRSVYWSYTRDPIWTTLPSGPGGYLEVPGWGYGQFLTVTSLALLIGFVACAAIMWRRMPASFRLYSAGLFAVCLAALFLAPDTFRSPGPYLLAAAPLFLLLGRESARRPSVDMLLVGCGFLLQAALALVWLGGLAPV